MLVVPMPTVTTVAKNGFSDEQIKDLIIQDFSGKRINILAPVIRARKDIMRTFQQIAKQVSLKFV
jgi:excinuclease ABC subunit A